jgi:shikimate kinase
MDPERLRPEEFDAHIASGTLRLAYVGMSNAGKSYRAKVLRNEMDFIWYNVDDEIRKALGLESVDDLSSWLGYPSSANYKEREARYLELENMYTKSAAMRFLGKNLVFDTTGSVIHLPQMTLNILRENCLIVHLDVGEDSLSKLIEGFFSNPKPVAWSGYFTMQPDETEEHALRRSYPVLLLERLKKYRELAHINVNSESLRNTPGAETLSIIRSKLHST